MKKTILGIGTGLFIGILFMMAIFTLLNMKPNNEDMLAQTEKVESEVLTESEDESLFDEDEYIEDEFETEEWEEEESEGSESESQVVQKPQQTVTPQKQPEDYPYYIRVNRLANCVAIFPSFAQ